MTQHNKQALLQFTMLLFICFSFPAVVQAAQSTADATADAALKEKLRKQIIGSSVPMDQEYVVGYRDILHISVYGEGSMSVGGGIEAEAPTAMPAGTASAVDFIRGRGAGIEVRMDGRISLRNIGDVAVVGMTLTQIADYLKQLYSTIYSDPDITATLVQSNSMQYTVMGQVIAPGLYHLDFPLTIVRAVARAGGFTEWANSSITVIRPNPAGGNTDKGKTYQFDFDDFLKGNRLENNILIKSGDVIVVH
jgi:polysaccharide export outer membrane protein